MKSLIKTIFFISLISVLSSVNFVYTNIASSSNYKSANKICNVNLEFKNNTNIIVSSLSMETALEYSFFTNIEVGGSRYSTLDYSTGTCTFTVSLPVTHPAGRLELYNGNTIIDCETVVATPNYAYEITFTPTCNGVYTLVYRKTNSPCP